MKLFTISAVLPCLLAATAAVTIPAHAATTYQVKVLTAGSSAQYGVFAEAAYQLAKTDGNAKHYTNKSSQCAAPGCAYIVDSRNANIPTEAGNLWVVWSETTGNVWAYLSVDSTVGVRSFEAAPRAKLNLLALASQPLSATTNLPVWDDKSNDTALNSGVYNAISNVAFTAANTDIRPEDALFATNRALAALNTTNYNGLGYLNTSISSGTCQIGYSYQSAITSGTKATPVAFSISGNDPCSGTAVTSFITLPVGAAPVIFIANKSNTSGLGSSNVNNVTVNGTNDAVKLFDGDECDASLLGGLSTVAVTPILREPLSGTMNTAEFTNFRLTAAPTLSQEKGVIGTSGSYNPLSLNCTAGGGKRLRGVGTGDVVKGVNATTDSIGYVFFSYEALVPASFPNVKYIKLDGYDPLATSTSSTYTGALPACGTGSTFSCPLTTPSSSFYYLRQGNYRSWSEYRVITDTVSTHQANAQALVTKAQLVADSTLPDFVPFNASCGATAAKDEPGLSVYRDHFTPAGITVTPNDGPVPTSVSCTAGGPRTLKARTFGGYSTTNNEAGGDVGGVINFVPSGTTLVPPGPTGSRQ